ncbi:hypothetical protein MLD38_033806 [Melastoma candidum]|uniref:Uncharacterized protein n=1 Tax=Melastoma candidum TaxID=119954 RepID=A0ACB9M998_9MYRT|nr:hypothetical protein MLD38_033806 [Melastoma candidum]
MIKRRFYKLEHGDRDANSGSSSSSDSEPDIEQQASEDDRDDGGVDAEEKVGSSSSSGYESEDSSFNEVGVDSSGLPLDEDDGDTVAPGIGNLVAGGENDEKGEAIFGDEDDSISPDALTYVLSCKSVFKCKICPRIVCLSKETLKAHLQSKARLPLSSRGWYLPPFSGIQTSVDRHARSEKLLNEGRLKAVLNSDGEIENQETAAEAHTRIMASAPEPKVQKRKSRGRQRQRMRAKTKLKASDSATAGNSAPSTQGPTKKRRQ